MSAIRCLAFALATALPAMLLPGAARAEMIVTPDSVFGVRITSPATDGAPAVGASLGQRYMPFGLEFGGLAVIDIDGVKAWAPTSDPLGTGAGDRLNFTDGTIWAAFGIPGTDTLAMTGYVSVEFLNVPPGLGAVEAFTATGDFLPFFNINGRGSHGGTVATLSHPGIFAVAISTVPFPLASTAGEPWGVAEVRFGPLTLVAAPEPGTLALAASGLAGLAGCLWSTRRCRPAASRSSHASATGDAACVASRGPFQPA